MKSITCLLILSIIILGSFNTASAEDDFTYSENTVFEGPNYEKIIETTMNIKEGDDISLVWIGNGTIAGLIVVGSYTSDTTRPNELGILGFTADEDGEAIIQLELVDDIPPNNETVSIEYSYNWNGDAAHPLLSTSDEESTKFNYIFALAGIILISSSKRIKRKFRS
ncbi:MAG: hypothetical protein ACXAD7_23785 [Candidatus Kariarchaeaceae archaeon]|jgi:hypothetical protein